MPPKQTTGAKRGRSSKAGGATAPKKQRASTSAADLDDPFASSNDETAGRRAAEVIDSDEEPSRGRADAEEEEEEEPEKTIPSGLVANLLKEMFAREETRMTEGASLAAARYIDVFVREAIARCVHEREGGFLEVDDLEKISAQLLMDF
ncbi:hypothetical protein HYQ45_002797 [Verticillium longisporum]|uniref:Centromere protein X n=1 Tax=Verticillium longisporum TaxID=100787 RepID=A0A8I3AVK7_VERLO|nr:hypothetical protein VdG1_00105 [Verticillium dahliae VDG1]KAG7140494.1 hypothetical protein HYQ45_002797 [Verticillium longisporum]RBQ85800.1 hypothetical protein VDGD_07536 [Verticillium dahliae]